MPAQFPSRAGIGIGPIVLFSVGDGSQNFLGSFDFSGKTIKHQSAITLGKFGRRTGHSIFSFRLGVDGRQQDRLRSGGFNYSSQETLSANSSTIVATPHHKEGYYRSCGGTNMSKTVLLSVAVFLASAIASAAPSGPLDVDSNSHVVIMEY